MSRIYEVIFFCENEGNLEKDVICKFAVFKSMFRKEGYLSMVETRYKTYMLCHTVPVKNLSAHTNLAEIIRCLAIGYSYPYSYSLHVYTSNLKKKCKDVIGISGILVSNIFLFLLRKFLLLAIIIFIIDSCQANTRYCHVGHICISDEDWVFSNVFTWIFLFFVFCFVFFLSQSIISSA